MTTALQGLLDRLVRLLDTANVPFMIAGSFASSAHGLPRTTQDLGHRRRSTESRSARCIGSGPCPRIEYYVDAGRGP
jgi:hypothetical protein